MNIGKQFLQSFLPMNEADVTVGALNSLAMMPYASAKTSLRTKHCTSSTTSCGSSEYGIQGTVTPCSYTTTSHDSTNFASTISSTTTNNPTDTENARDTKNTTDPQGPQDSRDPKDSRDPQSPQGTQGPQGSRDPHPQGSRDTQGPQGSRDTKGPQGPRDTKGPHGPRNAKNAKDWVKANRKRMIQATWVRVFRKAIKAREAEEIGITSDTANGNPFEESSLIVSTRTAKDSTYPISAINSPKDSTSGSKAFSTLNTEKSNKSDQSTVPPVLMPLDREKVKKWAEELHGSEEEGVDPTEESNGNECIGEAHKLDEESDRSEYNGVANQPIEEKYRGKVESLIVSDCSNSDGGVEL